MNFLGVYPAPDLLEESWRELEARATAADKEARAARRAMRPSRFAAFTALVRSALQPIPGPPLAEGC